MRGLFRRLIIGIGGMGRRGISYRVDSCFGYEVLMYSFMLSSFACISYQRSATQYSCRLL
jgi:hypothetical protein